MPAWLRKEGTCFRFRRRVSTNLAWDLWPHDHAMPVMYAYGVGGQEYCIVCLESVCPFC